MYIFKEIDVNYAKGEFITALILQQQKTYRYVTAHDKLILLKKNMFGQGEQCRFRKFKIFLYLSLNITVKHFNKLTGIFKTRA